MKKLFKYLSGIFAVFVLLIIADIHILGNFYDIGGGVYRSGELNKYNLTYYAKKHKFKTIINLNGVSSRDIYKNEIKIAKELNITHINHKLSNRKFLDYNQTKYLSSLIKDAKKPLLIHCIGGADRTSLASALYHFDILGKTKKQAKKQFSIIYGHAPLLRPYVKAMGDSFDNHVKKSKDKNK
ncbi:MAG: protein tyrosine phosphatase [Epsilonproteobacteria bacterium]|nr:MAG: protein tyrosine phosphatase [Campylobacterota bacterium]